MGNTTVKWMTLYRQERKAHQQEIEKLKNEYELKLLDAQTKNDWLSEKLIENQKKLRVLTLEIIRKEEQIDALHASLRRAQKFRRSAPKETPVETSVSGSAGSDNRNSGEHDLPV